MCSISVDLAAQNQAQNEPFRASKKRVFHDSDRDFWIIWDSGPEVVKNGIQGQAKTKIVPNAR